MHVVLDTSVIVEDYRLTSTTSRLLLESLNLAGCTLVVPEIVILETVNKFRESLDADAKKLSDTASKVTQKLGDYVEPPLHSFDVPDHMEAYEAYLRARLTEHGASIPSFPSVSHEEVVRRALARRRPFSQDGRRGYRDALIWETIRELAKSTDDKITFITLNKNDFAVEDGILHSDLINDLKDDGHASNKVTLRLKVHDFLNQHVIPALPPVEQTIARLGQKVGPGFDLEDALAVALHDPLVDYQLEEYGGEIESVSVSSIQGIRDIEFEHEAELSDDEVLLELNACVFCEFDGFVFKSSYMVMSDKERGSFHIWDPDRNDHYMAVSFTTDTMVRAYVTVDLDKAQFTNIDVLEVEFIDENEY